MEQVQDRVAQLRAGVITGRRVDKIVSLVADDARLIEMMLHFAMRDIVDLPRQRRRTGDVHHAVDVQQVGFEKGVARIEEGHAVSLKRVAVVIRLERRGGNAPHAGFIFFHGHSLRPFERKHDNFRVWIPGTGR